ncbi:non-specific serine,threonine protein kinase [Sarracenia purpurea var. burkii]
MKLSDFGLCKPLDYSNLSPINENEVMNDENLRESMDYNGHFPDYGNGSRWKSPLEQLQHWQMNRRTLVCESLALADTSTPRDGIPSHPKSGGKGSTIDRDQL